MRMTRLYMNYHKILLLGILLMVLAGCGQYGNLYLPDKEAEAEVVSDQEAK